MLYNFDIMKIYYFIKKWRITLLFILISILLVLLSNNLYSGNNGVKFLTKREVCKLLTENSDKYYDTFNENDLLVRSVKSKSEYVKKIKNSCYDFSREEKEILKKCANSVKLRLSKTQINLGPGFDNIKASKIPIIFGCMTGNEYEGGLPHTRYPAIILYSGQVTSMSALDVEKLIIHEVTHLYQKMYPNDLKKYLNENHFEIIKQRRGNDNVRANPDIDSYIYRNQINNQAYEYIYNPFPGSIGDVIRSNKEHPFEEMAHKMENIIT